MAFLIESRRLASLRAVFPADSEIAGVGSSRLLLEMRWRWRSASMSVSGLTHRPPQTSDSGEDEERGARRRRSLDDDRP